MLIFYEHVKRLNLILFFVCVKEKVFNLFHEILEKNLMSYLCNSGSVEAI